MKALNFRTDSEYRDNTVHNRIINNVGDAAGRPTHSLRIENLTHGNCYGEFSPFSELVSGVASGGLRVCSLDEKIFILYSEPLEIVFT